MGGPGSGSRRRRQKGVIIAESCLVLDAYQLLAKGCLEPGWTGVWRCTTANNNNNNPANAARVWSSSCLVKLRAKVGQMVISWPGENGTRLTERVRIVYMVSRPYFVCPGSRTPPEAEAEAGVDDAGSGGVEANPGAGSGDAGVEADADAGEDADTDAGEEGDASNDCGRRVVKLYLIDGRFRCRHCHGLIHASPYEKPWQRAYRKARKLRQYLGLNGGVVPGKPKGMTVHDYERLLEAAQQAEARAYEAGTAHIFRLAARIKPRFTL
jgi:hypothetical protein